VTAFSVIFVSEFGDLSQIQAANLTVKTHQRSRSFSPRPIALISVSFLGAYGGNFSSVCAVDVDSPRRRDWSS